MSQQLDKIELSLEILHTRSKIAQDSQKKSTQHLEEETIEVKIKSKSIQLKTKKKQQHRFNRCPYHRSIRCLAEVPTPCRSISLGSKLKSSQVTLYHRLNRQSQAKHRCIRCSLFQRACLVDLNSSSAPVEPTLQNQPPVHWMYYVPESLFELISEPFQHRLNRCPYGSCTGAMTQAQILCQNPQWLLFGHRKTG